MAGGWRRLCSKEIFQRSFNFVQVCLALEAGADKALAVDEVGDWQAKDAAVELAELCVAHCPRSELTPERLLEKLVRNC